MPDFRETLTRVGDDAEPDAFLYADLLRYPAPEDWPRLNPPREGGVGVRDAPRRPRYPKSLAGVSLARNLSPVPRPGESKANAQKRAKRARSYRGKLGAYAVAERRFNERSEGPAGGIYAQWRVELTGYAQVTDQRAGPVNVGDGVQLGPWQRIERGRPIASEKIKAAYLDTARAAVRTKTYKGPPRLGADSTDAAHGPGDETSTIYKGDSDAAVIYPTLILLRVQWG